MVRFIQSIDEQDFLPTNIIVIGSKESLQDQVCNNNNNNNTWLHNILLKKYSKSSIIHKDISSISSPQNKKLKIDLNHSYQKDIVMDIINQLTPNTEDSAISDYYYHNHYKNLIKVTFCALPITFSRHNSSSRPHAITEIIKKYKNGNNNNLNDHYTFIIMLLDNNIEMFASGCAIAKGISLYNSKNINNTNQMNNNKINNNIITIFHHVINKIYNDNLTNNIKLIQSTADSIQFTAKLVDMPPNELTTSQFIKEAMNEIQNLKPITSTIIKGEELKNKNFGGIYGVGKAAKDPPALVILTYKPTTSTTTTNNNNIVLVGKGITYDTGGLSLKTPQSMVGMKRDMAGAAALLGAFLAAVKNNCKIKLSVILCLAENSISEKATKPDDIHILYSGKSVEVNNTDAEGRLVLADGVHYAVKHLEPTIIIDMATLTGAQGIATGRYVGAIYCNDELLEDIALKQGRKTGDLVHNVPYIPEFFKNEFKSSIADMKNSVKDRSNAQCSCAGQFIYNHLGDDYEKNGGKWLHIDMAYPSFTASDERATGYGVALIEGILENYGAF